MAVYQIKSGPCTGRGFADVDASGWCAYFKDWVTQTPVNGGPEWNILLDKSPLPTGKDFTVASTGVSHVLGCVSHGYLTGETGRVNNVGGALPGGLYSATDYLVYKIDNDRFRLCSNMTACWDGTGANVTSAGTGTQTSLLEGPYIVVSDQSSPTINQSAMIMRLGYKATESAKIRVQYCLSFDTTNKVLYGYWGGYVIDTLDAGAFSYDFRGGDECMFVQSRIGSSWSTAGIDAWMGDPNFVEGTDKRGVLQSDVTAGSNIVLPLNSGEELNFTPNKYYYITDMSGHFRVNYCKALSDDTVAHTVTVNTLTLNFPAGSVIAAYEHRWYSVGDTVINTARFNSGGVYSVIPYYSSQIYTECFSGPDSIIYGSVCGARDSVTLSVVSPNDRGYYSCQKPFIVEYLNCSAGSQTANMSEGYGVVKNIYATKMGTKVAGLDGLTVSGQNWLFFQQMSLLFSAGDSALGVLLLDSTSMV